MDSTLPRSETTLGPGQESVASPTQACGNCSTPLRGPYCSQCGEKKISPRDYSLPQLAEELVGVFTHLDTKFLRTLKALFTKPGELSKAYFLGGRSRYTKPLTVFVIINVVFFIVQPHTGLLSYKYANYINSRHLASVVRGHLLATKEPEESYAARFNANLQNQKKSLLIVSVPVLALVMAVFFIGTGRTYAEHLVFSVQVYAFLLSYLAVMVFAVLFPLTLLIATIAPSMAPAVRFLESELGITVLTITALTIYMYHGLRRAHDASPLRAGISAFALAWTIGFLTGVYRNALFYATFWTT